jgi:CPA2 family monovalent cation:H+ antiporter-2
VASTVVLIRALMARNALESNEGRITVGWLIVEDLLSVLILVILPVLGPSIGGAKMDEKNINESIIDVFFREGDSVLAHLLRQVGMKETFPVMFVVALLNVALLVAIVFLGKKAAVWFLQQVDKTKSEELFTLFVVAIALFVAFGAKAAFGLSVALGAFLAGIMLGDSVLSHRIGSDVRPLRDIFGVIFFTAVGMLFDPRTIIKMPIPLIVILFVIMIGKPLIAGAIVLALKQPMRSVLVIAPALGQIGEFSFILAVVASRMGILPEQPYQLIITGSILSIALNPVMFWVGDMLAKRLPPQEVELEPALNPAA